MTAAFAGKRLLTLNDGTAEISHDVLLHAWPLLGGWLADDQASLILYSQLAEDAAAWRGSRDDPSFLYRGTQLAAIRQAAARWAADPARYPALDTTERDFLDASRRATNRGARQRRVLAATLVVLVIAAVTGAAVAVRVAQTANSQRNFAVSGKIALQSEALDAADPVTAAQLAAAAWRIDPKAPEAREAMLDVVAQPCRAVLDPHMGALYGVACSPDGTVLATAENHGTVLWNVSTHRQIGTAIRTHVEAVDAVAFSPDGKVLATAGNDGRTRLWNVATHHQIGKAMGADASLLSEVAFSSDGTLLATASWDGTARLWDVATQRQIGPPMSVGLNLMNGVAFSPDGKILATAGADGAARLWDIAFPRDLPRAVCAIAGRSLTRAEWNNYAPAESFQRACP